MDFTVPDDSDSIQAKSSLKTPKKRRRTSNELTAGPEPKTLADIYGSKLLGGWGSEN